MRTTKELLIILRDNLENYITLKNPFGICFVIENLYEDSLINNKEYRTLSFYLGIHKLKKPYNKHYWWVPGEIKPRFEWLNKQIGKL